MNKKVFLVHSALAVAAITTIGGCSSPRVEGKVAADNKEAMTTGAHVVNGQGIGKDAGAGVAGGAADADRRAAEQSKQVVLRRSSKPWVASVSVPMGSGEKLPSVFQEPVRLTFKDSRSGGKVSLRVVAERITAATGVPVRVKADVFATSSLSSMPGPGPAAIPLMPAGGQAGLPPTSPIPAGQPPAESPRGGGPLPTQLAPVETSVDAVAMRWTGSLEGFLNHVTDLTSLSWEYRDGVIVIERFRTEFFEIASLDSETSYSMGLNANDQGSTGSGGSGGGGASASNSNANIDVVEKGRSNALNTILAAINQIIKDVPGSNAIRTEGSGRIAVTTSKEVMAKVRDFVRAENDSMLRQAQVQFDIYSVRTSETNARGVEWDALLRSLSDGVAFNLKSPPSNVGKAGSIGFSVLDPGSRADRFGNSQAILQLLNQFGTATQHRPISLLTLNRQWARKASLGSKAYVAETTPAPATFGGTSGGAPGLKAATITTGDRYLAQPYIMDNNTVVLKFGIGLSSLVDLPTFTSAGQTIQTPEVNNIIDQSTVVLKSGQVLAITGLSRIIASDDENKLTEDSPIGVGGSKKLARQREDFIIFVRSTLL